MPTLYEPRHPGEFIINEDPGTRSREALKIAENQDFEPGVVLGKIAVVADVVASAAARAANAGNATIAMGTPNVTTKVKDGRYKGIAVTATTVRWEDPEGKEVGTSTHGAEFAKGGVKFTITAGGNANVAGDEFYVDVAADGEDFQYVEFNQDGTDGSEIPAALAIYGAKTGSGETTKIAGIVRNAEVNGNCIAWPDDLTAGERVNAEQSLSDLGIIVRN